MITSTALFFKEGATVAAAVVVEVAVEVAVVPEVAGAEVGAAAVEVDPPGARPSRNPFTCLPSMRNINNTKCVYKPSTIHFRRVTFLVFFRFDPEQFQVRSEAF